MAALVAPLQKKLDALEEENKKLREDVETPIAGSINNTSGKSTNMRAARSVVISTRPVQDNPNDELWNKLGGKIADSTIRPRED